MIWVIVIVRFSSLGSNSESIYPVEFVNRIYPLEETVLVIGVVSLISHFHFIASIWC